MVEYIKPYEETRDICHGFKDSNITAIKEMAINMSKLITAKSILIPLPSRIGYATTTLILVEEICKLSNSSILDVLIGSERESLYILKKEHKEIPNSLNFSLKHNILKSNNFVLIDNVFDTGKTMQEALNLIPGARCLVYAKSNVEPPKI